jgi:hypothetical protein
VDAKSSLGDAKSSLGDAESSLGGRKELAGWTLRARWVTLRARWVDAKSSLGGVQGATFDSLDWFPAQRTLAMFWGISGNPSKPDVETDELTLPFCRLRAADDDDAAAAGGTVGDAESSLGGR